MTGFSVWRICAVGCIALAACVPSNDVASRSSQTSANEVRVSGKAPAASVSERRFTAYLTGYTYWDNTPPGSAAIARPVIHRRAGGIGTYDDPVTLAVGHKIIGGRQTLDYEAGTRFYIPNLRRYAIVEDVCGDGPRPQNGPCHTGHRGHPWLDIYLDGRRVGDAESQRCAYRITGLQTVVINPRPGYPVDRGPISESGCGVYPS